VKPRKQKATSKKVKPTFKERVAVTDKNKAGTLVSLTAPAGAIRCGEGEQEGVKHEGIFD
jgi:hypothetical protein